jgi:hypothetical protein
MAKKQVGNFHVTVSDMQPVVITILHPSMRDPLQFHHDGLADLLYALKFAEREVKQRVTEAPDA